MINNTVGFNYGIVSESLEVQANKQGYTLGDKAEKIDKTHEAIKRLCIEGYFTESQYSSILKKFNKNVVSKLKIK